MDDPKQFSGPNGRVLDLLLNHIRDHAVIEVDDHGQILAFNRTVARVFGYSEDEASNLSFAQLYPAAQRTPERVREMLEVADRRGSFEEEADYQRKNGQPFRGHTVVLKEGVEGSAPRYMIVVRDLSVLMASRDQLHALATADQLTGLTNRQHIFDLGRVEYRRWKRYQVPLSLMLADIDGFGALNARYGEGVGDSLLRDVANIVRKSVRDVDLVARVENDTFAALLFSTPPEGAATLAERMRSSIANHAFTPQGLQLNMTISLAAITAHPNAADFDQLYEQSEKGLWQARNRGGNCIEIL